MAVMENHPMAIKSLQCTEEEGPELRNGDCMTRQEFHRAYCAMPESYRAELIGGIVFEPSPVSYAHGQSDVDFACLLREYALATPGTGVAHNVTVILSDDDEVQPDLILRVDRKFGGASRETKEHYIVGPPELAAEIVYSSRAIDFHLKKERYALAGVIEYVVVCLRPKRVYWFDLGKGKMLEADKKGVFRSVIFPGLWIHGKGLLDLDFELTKSTLKRGLRSVEHKRFVEELTERRC